MFYFESLCFFFCYLFFLLFIWETFRWICGTTGALWIDGSIIINSAYKTNNRVVVCFRKNEYYTKKQRVAVRRLSSTPCT